MRRKDKILWTVIGLWALVLLGLGAGLAFMWATESEVKAQCGSLEVDVLAYDDVACVVYDRKQARALGVPKKLRVRTLIGCLGGDHENLLVFGVGKRKGHVRCSGYGPVNGEDFSACGIMW